jgi:hypothetical protein
MLLTVIPIGKYEASVIAVSGLLYPSQFVQVDPTPRRGDLTQKIDWAHLS